MPNTPKKTKAALTVVPTVKVHYDDMSAMFYTAKSINQSNTPWHPIAVQEDESLPIADDGHHAWTITIKNVLTKEMRLVVAREEWIALLTGQTVGLPKLIPAKGTEA